MNKINIFDITAGCLELKKIETEQKRLQAIQRDLKKKKLDLEVKIQKYLDDNKHQGVVLNDMTVLNEQRKKTKPLSKIEKETKITNLLKEHKIDATDEFINKLNNATKGNTTEIKKIKITKQ